MILNLGFEFTTEHIFILLIGIVVLIIGIVIKIISTYKSPLSTLMIIGGILCIILAPLQAHTNYNNIQRNKKNNQRKL